MITISAVPIASGIQPPSNTLSRLAERKMVSTARNGVITSTDTSSGHFQQVRITKNAMMLVITMVPVTAMPNAEASALDDLNANTR